MTQSHYHFDVSLRIRHPDADPNWITGVLGEKPNRAWRAGDLRRTPSGRLLQGLHRQTYWFATVLTGRHPEPDLPTAIKTVLARLERFHDFFRLVRVQGGSVELFVGWCFDRQSGGTFEFETLAKAAHLQLDISFDVYPPTQPQNERAVELRFDRRATSAKM